MSYVQTRIPKQQIFYSSGTFTPSTSLIQAGGLVNAFIVGGGCGGLYGTTNYFNGCGGGVLNYGAVQLSLTQTNTVIVGAGGAGSLVSQNVGTCSGIYYTSTVTGTVATTGGTTLTASATNSILNNTYIRIDSEIMYVTAGQGTVSLTVIRGQLNTTAATHTAATIYVFAGAGGGNSTTSGGDTNSGQLFYAISAFYNDGTNSGTIITGAGGGGNATATAAVAALTSGTFYTTQPGPGVNGFGIGAGVQVAIANTLNVINPYPTNQPTATRANSGGGGSAYPTGGPASGQSGIVIIQWYE